MNGADRVLAALLLSVFGACDFLPGSPIEGECRDINREFLYGRTAAERNAAVAKLKTLEQQFTVCLCGMWAIHPPASYLIEPIAQR